MGILYIYILYYVVLNCIILYYIVLYYIILFYYILYYIILCFIMLYYIYILILIIAPACMVTATMGHGQGRHHARRRRWRLGHLVTRCQDERLCMIRVLSRCIPASWCRWCEALMLSAQTAKYPNQGCLSIPARADACWGLGFRGDSDVHGLGFHAGHVGRGFLEPRTLHLDQILLFVGKLLNPQS